MTRHTYFISDLHLSESHPEISQAFFDFVEKKATHADALYILGDFFEVWVGDDHITPLSESVCQALQTLHKQGTAIYLMHGNRDFLMGQAFCQQAGATLLEDPCMIDCYGKPILLCHGDSLCTDDISHQRFRRITHQRWLQKLFLYLPLKWRQKIAHKIRLASQNRPNDNMNDQRYDVTLEATTRLMQSHEADCLIHGHTHKPDCHDLTVQNQPALRYVLGAWEEAAQILRIDDQQIISFETLTIIKSNITNET